MVASSTEKRQFLSLKMEADPLTLHLSSASTQQCGQNGMPMESGTENSKTAIILISKFPPSTHLIILFTHPTDYTLGQMSRLVLNTFRLSHGRVYSNNCNLLKKQFQCKIRFSCSMVTSEHNVALTYNSYRCNWPDKQNVTLAHS